MRMRATVSASVGGTPRPRYIAASSRCSPAGSSTSSACSTSISCCTSSSWALTDTSSPAAIEKAPASSPATPATRTALPLVPAPATPRTSEILVSNPSPEPRTAARAPLPWTSRWRPPRRAAGRKRRRSLAPNRAAALGRDDDSVSVTGRPWSLFLLTCRACPVRPTEGSTDRSGYRVAARSVPTPFGPCATGALGGRSARRGHGPKPGEEDVEAPLELGAAVVGRQDRRQAA